MTSGAAALETVCIDNDPVRPGLEIAKAGADPEVVVEATDGWYWSADVLQAAGVRVRLAHPLGVKGFTCRRAKNDVRDAADLADLLRMGRLPEAYVAPPAVRELRVLVRHRAKLVAWRSDLKASVHAVLAEQGLRIAVTDLFGVGGRELRAAAPLGEPFRARVDALCRLVDAVDFELAAVAGPLRARLAGHSGFRAIQAIPGVGPVLAAIFVAERGKIDRFAGPTQAVFWAGLTPKPGLTPKHRESDLVVHRRRITMPECMPGSRAKQRQRPKSKTLTGPAPSWMTRRGADDRTVPTCGARAAVTKSFHLVTVGQVIAGRRTAEVSFIALGTACVVAGGLVAAATAPAPSVHGSWAAAYLVLVAGVSQVALGLGQARLAPRVPSGRRVVLELGTWNGGNAAVLAGVLASITPLVDLGGVLLVIALAVVALGLRGSGVRKDQPWARWSLYGFRLLVLVLLVSIPIGLVLARIGPA